MVVAAAGAEKEAAAATEATVSAFLRRDTEIK
jgi:hypothetical protein